MKTKEQILHALALPKYTRTREFFIAVAEMYKYQPLPERDLLLSGRLAMRMAVKHDLAESQPGDFFTVKGSTDEE